MDLFFYFWNASFISFLSTLPSVSDFFQYLFFNYLDIEKRKKKKLFRSHYMIKRLVWTKSFTQVFN